MPSGFEGQPQGREQVRREVAAAQRRVVVLAAHAHQAGAARRVPQHPGGQPGLRAVRVPGGLFGGGLPGRRTASSCAAGGSTTISCTSTQPATSSGQEICASASESSPSGKGSCAIGVYTAGPSDAARVRLGGKQIGGVHQSEKLRRGIPARGARELLDLGDGERQVGILPPLRRAHADDLCMRATAFRPRGGRCSGLPRERRCGRSAAPSAAHRRLHTVKSVSIQRSGSDRPRWAGNLWAVLTVDGAGQLTFRPRTMSRGAVASPCGRTCTRVST